jgi:hypothetical protein
VYEYWRCSRRYCFSSTLGHSFMIYLMKVNKRKEERREEEEEKDGGK